eukprot:TRINITY_DN9442_c0_g2_i1.p1 TRINITY_DN9442_c0_g2~~TRINITY_DN9442_c0_g2_i1.p1  ORF type:complete len:133 (+),score=12.44 TRINITY_DN9442_c0_g2_i1:1336-1734(+)
MEPSRSFGNFLSRVQAGPGRAAVCLVCHLDSLFSILSQQAHCNCNPTALQTQVTLQFPQQHQTKGCHVTATIQFLPSWVSSKALSSFLPSLLSILYNCRQTRELYNISMRFGSSMHHIQTINHEFMTESHCM